MTGKDELITEPELAGCLGTNDHGPIPFDWDKIRATPTSNLHSHMYVHTHGSLGVGAL